MAYIPVPNTCSVELFFTSAGQQLENVYHVVGDDPFTESTLEDVGDIVMAWATDHFMPPLSNDISLVGMKVTSLETDTAPVWEPSLGEAVPGSETGDAIPLNACGIVTWKTALRGRSYRGRTYVAGIPESFVENSAISTAYQTTLHDVFSLLHGGIVSESYNLAVVSRVNDGAPRTTGVATVVTSFQVKLVLASQRRRLPGRGS